MFAKLYVGDKEMKIIKIFLIFILILGLASSQGTNIVQVKNFYNDVNARNHTIFNLEDPVLNQDAATKFYVDNISSMQNQTLPQYMITKISSNVVAINPDGSYAYRGTAGSNDSAAIMSVMGSDRKILLNGDFTAESCIYKVIGNNIELAGTPGSSITAKNSLGDDVILMSAITGLYIHGFEINGNRANQITGDGLKIRNCKDVVVERMKIHDTYLKGITLSGTVADGLFRVIIEKNHIYNTGGDGIEAGVNALGQAANITVSKNVIHDVGLLDEINPYQGIQGYWIINMEIDSNTIYNINPVHVLTSGITYACVNATDTNTSANIHDNTIYNSSWMGIHVQNGNNIKVHHNTIDKVQGNGILAENPCNASINDNDIADTGLGSDGTGISLYSEASGWPKLSRVENNGVEGAGGQGIYTDASLILIIGNKLRNCCNNLSTDDRRKAGILVNGDNNTVALNLVIDDRDTPLMEYGISDYQNGDYNIFLGNNIIGMNISNMYLDGTGNIVNFPTDINIGDSTNYTKIDTDGSITFAGTNKRHLSMRPTIVLGNVSNPIKPTIVQYGAYSGYSLPIYNSDDEELFFNEYVAGRWDGVSNLTVSVIGYLDTAETADDDFNLSLDWTNKATGSGAISNTVNKVYQVTNCPTGRNGQYSIYKIEFPIDWDLPGTDLTESDIFSARLYRTAVGVGNVEIAGEFVVCLVEIRYQVDKVFKA